MRIMTFNLRIALDSDGEHRWERRLPLLEEFFGRVRVPILCAQELDPAMLADLLRAIPGYRAVGAPRDRGRGEGTPILYDPKAATLCEASTRWLSDTPAVPSSLPGSFFPRIVVAAVFETPDGRTFRVACAHLDYGAEAVRRRQTEILLSILDEADPARVLPTIVAGDFNAGPGESLHGLFRAAGYRSAFPSASSPSTFHAFGKEAEAIDYVYGRGLSFADAKVMRERPMGRYLSDHDPILVSARFRRTPASPQ